MGYVNLLQEWRERGVKEIGDLAS